MVAPSPRNEEEGQRWMVTHGNVHGKLENERREPERWKFRAVKDDTCGLWNYEKQTIEGQDPMEPLSMDWPMVSVSQSRGEAGLGVHHSYCEHQQYMSEKINKATWTEKQPFQATSLSKSAIGAGKSLSSMYFHFRTNSK